MITLPALFQQSLDTGNEVYEGARKAKAKDYPRKDSDGRLINASPCLPFILTSMGGLCSEGHEFLRVCRKRNPEKIDTLLDVLVTQHSRWTARRIHRALFGQSLIDFSGTSWTNLSSHKTSSRISNRCKHKTHANQTHILSKFSKQFTATEQFESDSDSDMDISPRDNCCEIQEVDVSRNDCSESHANNFSQQDLVRESEPQHVGCEDLRRSNRVSPAISQRPEFFELSPP